MAQHSVCRLTTITDSPLTKPYRSCPHDPYRPTPYSLWVETQTLLLVLVFELTLNRRLLTRRQLARPSRLL